MTENLEFSPDKARVNQSEAQETDRQKQYNKVDKKSKNNEITPGQKEEATVTLADLNPRSESQFS